MSVVTCSAIPKSGNGFSPTSSRTLKSSIVRHHHERVDGQGYPGRDRGTPKFPFLSRIIAVADAYNAMTSDGPIVTRCPAGSRGFGSRKPSRPNSTPRWSPHSRRYWLGADEYYRLAKSPHSRSARNEPEGGG